ncbi:solute carrier family 23 member 2-like isoform X2 [Orbicella faveolata]|uniref:solute carrier family 23 member 2-like isoform X2 n=1 Tax=Orbicella faveolata TaxID=48498 RepID=UPI0009E2EAD4|nr:solute carrier family 23 member 2-like isoform X2 [Orbicella faveolata]
MEIRDEEESQMKRKEGSSLAYCIDDTPPWYLNVVLGFQHYLTMFGSTLAIPFVLAKPMCYDQNPLATSEIIGTIFFVSGVCTLLQTIFGNRLPIVQGGTFSFLTPTIAILSLPRWTCPSASPTGLNNFTTIASFVNNTTASPIDYTDIWKPRMREIQGAIMVAALFQIVIGFSGLVGFLLRFIGPLTIAPTVTLVGLSLFQAAAYFSGIHWGISAMTMVVITIFSQYLKQVKVPLPAYSRQRGMHLTRFPLFRLFPILLGVVFAWIICATVTAAGGFTDNKNSTQYRARTDARIFVLTEAEWFRFPYPGQWGRPTVSAAGVFGMLAGVLASMIESIGDYYACARLSGAPPPPKHAINRGIGMEGIGCLLAGAWGSGNGTTSYSENIGAIGITKVGSRRVVQYGAVIMMFLGILGKFGALFTTIPDPIVGGVFMVMFGMITAVGISNLQFVDLNSSRNLFILGFSLVFGMALPYWLSQEQNKNVIQTGEPEIDQIITVLLRTNMLVGGIAGFVLDNTIPGSREERGMVVWNSEMTEVGHRAHVYDLPFGLKKLSFYNFAKYVPFLPYYGNEETPAVELREAKKKPSGFPATL